MVKSLEKMSQSWMSLIVEAGTGPASEKRGAGRRGIRCKYVGLDHLYFSKEWFTQTLDGLNCQVEIEDQAIPNYLHSPYRFNVFITLEADIEPIITAGYEAHATVDDVGRRLA